MKHAENEIRKTDNCTIHLPEPRTNNLPFLWNLIHSQNWTKRAIPRIVSEDCHRSSSARLHVELPPISKHSKADGNRE